RDTRVGGSRFSSGKDSTFSNSSLTTKTSRELSWNKPHSSLEEISLGQLCISSQRKLEGKPPLGNDSRCGKSYNHRESRLVNKCSSEGNEEECHPVISSV
ncbi:hypothetical protein A2U01_0020159, partial [Trifolium medium]|nr:hypothetical protein [Trifolium medium]